MKDRATLPATHFGGKVRAGVDAVYANAPQLTPAVASSPAIVEAVGDDTNITLLLRGKGTGGVSFAGATANGTTGIGYATGAGGAVTQLTSKSTTVVLSKLSGAITMNNAALAADVIVSFTLTNTLIAATDVLILNHISGGTVGAYTFTASAAAGSAVISVANRSAGSLSDAVVIQFAVIKAVNA